MIPSEPYLVICPICGIKLKTHDFISGNTFGATWWSDLYVSGPFLPKKPEYVKCPNCESFLEMDLMEEDHESHIEGAIELPALTIQDVEDGLKLSRWTSEEIFHLRMTLWHMYNHPYRNIDQKQILVPEAYRENAIALIKFIAKRPFSELSDINDEIDEYFKGISVDHRVIVADLLRNMGEFHLSQDVLAGGQYQLDEASYLTAIMGACLEEISKPLIIYSG